MTTTEPNVVRLIACGISTGRGARSPCAGSRGAPAGSPRPTPSRSSVFPGCALGDVRLQVAQQELRVDRLTLVASWSASRRARGPPGRGRSTAERDCGAGLLHCARGRPPPSRRRSRRGSSGLTIARCAPSLEDERRPERRADDDVRSGRREPADVDAADRDAAAGSASASACRFGVARRRRRGRGRGLGRRLRCGRRRLGGRRRVGRRRRRLRSRRSGRSRPERRVAASANADNPIRSRRLKGSQCTAQNSAGSFVITPSTPGGEHALERRLVVHRPRETAAPRACAVDHGRAGDDRVMEHRRRRPLRRSSSG